MLHKKEIWIETLWTNIQMNCFSQLCLLIDSPVVANRTIFVNNSMQKMHQNARTSVWLFKNSPGVVSQTPIIQKGRVIQRRGWEGKERLSFETHRKAPFSCEKSLVSAEKRKPLQTPPVGRWHPPETASHGVSWAQGDRGDISGRRLLSSPVQTPN